jgi:hypothetical protein
MVRITEFVFTAALVASVTLSGGLVVAVISAFVQQRLPARSRIFCGHFREGLRWIIISAILDSVFVSIVILILFLSMRVRIMNALGIFGSITLMVVGGLVAIRLSILAGINIMRKVDQCEISRTAQG